MTGQGLADLTVGLGDRSYPIMFRHNEAASLPATLLERLGDRRWTLITNTTVGELYGEQIAGWKRDLNISVHTIPDGERYKTVETWQALIDAMLQARIDRQGAIIALGGGVVGDIAGFCAASVLRGIDYIQIPTTLLAMVDSAVGGKTAVNHRLGKNLIGAFHQPRLVWVDTGYLSTLPRREYVAGYAELFKYAFIGGRDMFEFIKKNREPLLAADPGVLHEGIRRSLEIKAAIVADDERETSGRRALLNFGHTFAHALEQAFDFTGLLHGEAVLWGIVAACDLGRRLASIPPTAQRDYDELLAGLPLQPLPRTPDAETLFRAMFFDKKVIGGRLRLVLPVEPGVATLRGDVPSQLVLDSIHNLVARIPSPAANPGHARNLAD